MYRSIFFLIVFFFIYQFSFSQSNYTPGYIVNYEGDTTQGLIKKQNGKNNSYQVIFKRNDNEEDLTYTPSDLKTYFVNTGELYIADNFSYRKVDIQAGEIIQESRESIGDKNVEIVETAAFLQVLVKGQVTLYSYVDDESEVHYFLRKENDKFHELYQRRKYAKWFYGGLIRDGYMLDKNYVGILNMLFYDCPEIVKKTENVDFEEKDLIKITQSYNEFVSPEEAESEVYASSGGMLLDISGFLGVNVSTYKFSSPNTGHFDYLTVPDPSYSQHLTFGFDLNLSNPHLSLRFSLRSGLSYFKIDYDYRYVNELTPIRSDFYDVHLENHYLKIPLLINYNFTTTILKPYIFIGTHTNIVLKSNNTMTKTVEDPTGTTVTEGPAIAPSAGTERGTRNYELLGLSTGAGIKRQKNDKLGYFFEFKYERIQSLSSISNLKQTSINYLFTGGLIF